jgi:hypothetical protein
VVLYSGGGGLYSEVYGINNSYYYYNYFNKLLVQVILIETLITLVIHGLFLVFTFLFRKLPDRGLVIK